MVPFAVNGPRINVTWLSWVSAAEIGTGIVSRSSASARAAIRSA
jgi:hypothetical protein